MPRPRASNIFTSTRRGLTLLEVMLAVALLAMATAIIMGTISSIDQMQIREQRQLAAFEMGHRLLLQYLQDETEMPNKNLPLDLGDYKFMYDVREEKVQQTLNSKQAAGDPPQGLDRFRMITVSVFGVDNTGDYPVAEEQLAQLSRVMDPFTPRNADALEKVESNPDRVLDRVKELMKSLGGGGG